MSDENSIPLHQRTYCAALAGGMDPNRAWDLATSTVERYMMKRHIRLKVGDEIPQMVRYRDAWHTVNIREVNRRGEIGLHPGEFQKPNLMVPVTECFKADERLFFTY